MQTETREQFERDMACNEADLLRWLPGASRERPVRVQGASAVIDLSDVSDDRKAHDGRQDESAASLTLRWQPLEDRRIALLRLERLRVSFEFRGVAQDQRAAFMRHFDLYTQRGGG